MAFLRDAFTFRPRQTRRLFTHEDAKFFNGHKILGGIALTHFAYRLSLWFKHGDMGLDDPEKQDWVLFVLYALHAALHVTSFQFHVPDRRNTRYNVIWPEMRWHTLLFAYRSIIVLLACWAIRRASFSATSLINIPLIGTNRFIKTPLFSHSVVKSILLFRGACALCTMIAADAVTLYYRKKNASMRAAEAAARFHSASSSASASGAVLSSEKNADTEPVVSNYDRSAATSFTSMTMRNNPYPAYIPPKVVKWNNLFYSVSQVLATLNVITSPTMDRVFMTLLPIQTAPFCMTLEKKGVITQAGWHMYYTITLLMNYMLAISINKKAVVHTGEGMASAAASEVGVRLPRQVYFALALGFAVCRFKFKMNKYLLWATVIAVVVMYA